MNQKIVEELEIMGVKVEEFTQAEYSRILELLSVAINGQRWGGDMLRECYGIDVSCLGLNKLLRLRNLVFLMSRLMKLVHVVYV